MFLFIVLPHLPCSSNHILGRAESVDFFQLAIHDLPVAAAEAPGPLGVGGENDGS